MAFRIPLFDLCAAAGPLEAELTAAATRVIQSGQWILGPELELFERELAATLGVGRALGVSSGTDAITAALLSAELPPGSRVVTTPFTFIATVSAIVRAGLHPVFADVEANSFSLDPRAVVASGEASAVVVVHLFGQPAPFEPLLSWAQRRDVLLLEDAAQALGARAPSGAVGTLGHAAAFSFFPTKSLGGFGDGGAVTTDIDSLALGVERVRRHGAAEPHKHVQLGGNYRLDELQAALLRIKLRYLEGRLARARTLAERYTDALGDVAELAVPRANPGEQPSYSLYTVRALERRDALAETLKLAGIEARVYYPTPLHLQPALRHLGYAPGDFPYAEARSKEALSLPLYPELSHAAQDEVVRVVRGFYGYLG